MRKDQRVPRVPPGRPDLPGRRVKAASKARLARKACAARLEPPGLRDLADLQVRWGPRASLDRRDLPVRKVSPDRRERAAPFAMSKPPAS